MLQPCPPASDDEKKDAHRTPVVATVLAAIIGVAVLAVLVAIGLALWRRSMKKGSLEASDDKVSTYAT